MSDFEKVIGLADMHGTVARVAVSGGDGDDDVMLHLSVESGWCGGRSAPTPEAARQLAAALLDAADRVEAAEA